MHTAGQLAWLLHQYDWFLSQLRAAALRHAASFDERPAAERANLDRWDVFQLLTNDSWSDHRYYCTSHSIPSPVYAWLSGDWRPALNLGRRRLRCLRESAAQLRLVDRQGSQQALAVQQETTESWASAAVTTDWLRCHASDCWPVVELLFAEELDDERRRRQIMTHCLGRPCPESIIGLIAEYDVHSLPDLRGPSATVASRHRDRQRHQRLFAGQCSCPCRNDSSCCLIC